MIELSGDKASRENALQFLDEMETRHDFLLTELDKLNANVELVLAEYSKNRNTASPPPAEAITQTAQQVPEVDSSDEASAVPNGHN